METRPSHDSLHALELARLEERKRARTLLRSSEKDDLAAAMHALEARRLEVDQRGHAPSERGEPR